MSTFEIVEWPAKVLETPAEVVETFDDEFKTFTKDMHETMHAKKGIGLAANQVGVLKRVFVIEIPWVEPAQGEEAEEKKWWHDKAFTFVNPKISAKHGKTKYLEGCLSFPEQYDYVQRAEEIKVDYQDESGETKSLEADGLFAICIQHELDHINGIVFINRMSRLKSGMIRKKMMKRAEVRRINTDTIEE